MNTSSKLKQQKLGQVIDYFNNLPAATLSQALLGPLYIGNSQLNIHNSETIDKT